MIKTKLPVGLVYGHKQTGKFTPTSDIYHEEGLFEKVIVYSYDDPENFIEHFNKHQPDVILTIGDTTKRLSASMDNEFSKDETLIRGRCF